uniref:Uncharacterized protein n=1 Tax=Oryza sativa subsp. japonica TaxID=39947 RepID=Q69M34_ORYSJ|nr:hypothetical protein [Oryza sativa Japonica Group]BAD36381.1 hypothetical protein [Oryza sativa Japonica Group]
MVRRWRQARSGGDGRASAARASVERSWQRAGKGEVREHRRQAGEGGGPRRLTSGAGGTVGEVQRWQLRVEERRRGQTTTTVVCGVRRPPGAEARSVEERRRAE